MILQAIEFIEKKGVWVILLFW